MIANIERLLRQLKTIISSVCFPISMNECSMSKMITGFRFKVHTHIFKIFGFTKEEEEKNSGRLRTEEILNLQTKGNFSNFIEYTFNLYLLNLPPTSTLATYIANAHRMQQATTRDESRNASNFRQTLQAWDQ